MVEYFAGVMAVANLFLAIVAGVIAISMFRLTKNKPELKPWKFLLTALVLFVGFQTISSLRNFGIVELQWATHVIASVIVAILIGALVTQLEVCECR